MDTTQASQDPILEMLLADAAAADASAAKVGEPGPGVAAGDSVVTEPCETSIGDAKTEAVETADAEVAPPLDTGVRAMCVLDMPRSAVQQQVAFAAREKVTKGSKAAKVAPLDDGASTALGRVASIFAIYVALVAQRHFLRGKERNAPLPAHAVRQALESLNHGDLVQRHDEEREVCRAAKRAKVA
jgi:hypothetical protein